MSKDNSNAPGWLLSSSVHIMIILVACVSFMVVTQSLVISNSSLNESSAYVKRVCDEWSADANAVSHLNELYSDGVDTWEGDIRSESEKVAVHVKWTDGMILQWRYIDGNENDGHNE